MLEGELDLQVAYPLASMLIIPDPNRRKIPSTYFLTGVNPYVEKEEFLPTVSYTNDTPVRYLYDLASSIPIEDIEDVNCFV